MVGRISSRGLVDRAVTDSFIQKQYRQVTECELPDFGVELHAADRAESAYISDKGSTMIVTVF
jgi:hypothetical protein